MIRFLKGLILIEHEKGHPKGYLIGDKKELKYLFVLRKHRRERVASGLVNQFIKTMGKDFYVLIHRQNSNAFKFYETLGFKRVGKTINKKNKVKFIVLKLKKNINNTVSLSNKNKCEFLKMSEEKKEKEEKKEEDTEEKKDDEKEE